MPSLLFLLFFLSVSNPSIFLCHSLRHCFFSKYKKCLLSTQSLAATDHGGNKCPNIYDLYPPPTRGPMSVWATVLYFLLGDVILWLQFHSFVIRAYIFVLVGNNIAWTSRAFWGQWCYYNSARFNFYLLHGVIVASCNTETRILSRTRTWLKVGKYITIWQNHMLQSNLCSIRWTILRLYIKLDRNPNLH